jgi:hypothetical protein
MDKKDAAVVLTNGLPRVLAVTNRTDRSVRTVCDERATRLSDDGGRVQLDRPFVGEPAERAKRLVRVRISVFLQQRERDF